MSSKVVPLIDPKTDDLARCKERRYLRTVRKSGRFICPQCGANLDDAGQYGSFDHEGSTIYQDVSCGHCGAKWADAYELDRVACFIAGASTVMPT